MTLKRSTALRTSTTDERGTLLMRGVTQLCVMLCPGFLAPAAVRRENGARAFTFPWGTEGDKVEVTAAQGAAGGRNQAFFVLMAGAGLVG